jgi:galacturonosyltransferase
MLRGRNMRIMILANNDVGLYKFRKELLEELLKTHEVIICLPNGEYIEKMVCMGCKFIPCDLLDRHGTNPVKDMRLFSFYKMIIKENRPDIVFTYTIKPNVYGGAVCSKLGIPYVANITGLGNAIENGGILQMLTLRLYKIGLRNAKQVFFQNAENRDFFITNHVVGKKTKLIPGSGVNLEEHQYEDYPEEDGEVRFLFIGRIMKDKGIEEFVKCADVIKSKFPKTQFDIVGAYDDSRYEDVIKQAEIKGSVRYYGQQDDVHSFIMSHHVTVLPSYHEGLSNVLLETAACGRPILASNIPGCRETFENKITGLAFEARNTESLINTVEQFINLSYDKKKEMGRLGREKMEAEYDRNLIIEAYINEIENMTR